VARIYISATYGDLKEHRDKVYHALRQLGHDAIAMEDYVATDQRPLAKCLEDVAACDLYVGIFAHRYGHVPDHDNPDRRSITELEYHHAGDRGIPRLVFLVDPAASWLPQWMDAFTGDGEQGRRIRALREELGGERLVGFFATAEELARQISVAVTNELARLSASQQTYQLVGALPAVQAGRGWTIPPPVPSFIGRDEQLATLRMQLASGGGATLVPTATLYGSGGIGKTQLALAYAQRYRADYELGWWVPAETELGVLTALASLGVALGLPAELPPVELAVGAREALGKRSGWLLLLDNAPDPTAVVDFLPGAGGGHVLVTSRNPAWQGVAEPIAVDLLPLGEAVGLLQRRSGDTDTLAATRLAEALGRLPLALEQAAAYAAQRHLSLADYLELFDERRAELLALGRPLAYHGTVDATFTLVLDRLRETSPAALVLLQLCALLAPDKLPLLLLLSRPALLPAPLDAAAADPVQRGEVVGLLYQEGLLTHNADDTARVHRLVQAVILGQLQGGDRAQRTAQAVNLLAELFPNKGDEPDHWSRCEQLFMHTQSVLDHARASEVASESLASLPDQRWSLHSGPWAWHATGARDGRAGLGDVQTALPGRPPGNRDQPQQPSE
jgi:hypothetical protein